MTLGLPLVVFAVLSKVMTKKRVRSASTKKRLLMVFNVFFALQLCS